VEVVVATVSGEVEKDEPLTNTDGDEQETPAGDPLTEQAKLTLPENPPEGVTVRVLVPLLPAVTEMAPLLLSVKLPAPVTMMAVLFSAGGALPRSAITFAVYVPPDEYVFVMAYDVCELPSHLNPVDVAEQVAES
jgi:hypothetical protein